MEEGCAKRLIQVGIRTMNAHQRKQAERFGVEVVETKELPALNKLKVAGPVYVSFDVDVLDPGFAPGVSHREPGGMSVREAIKHLHAITGEIVGADLVEYNPAPGCIAIDGDGLWKDSQRDSGEDDRGMNEGRGIRLRS
jgi:arginase family enzyme